MATMKPYPQKTEDIMRRHHENFWGQTLIVTLEKHWNRVESGDTLLNVESGDTLLNYPQLSKVSPDSYPDYLKTSSPNIL